MSSINHARLPNVQGVRATKAWCGQAVGVAGVVQHEPVGTDVSQPSCMTGRCDLSLSTAQSQPGEGVGATCSGSRRSFVFLPFPILSCAGRRRPSQQVHPVPSAICTEQSGLGSQAMPQRHASRPWVVEIYFSKWSSAIRAKYL